MLKMKYNIIPFGVAVGMIAFIGNAGASTETQVLTIPTSTAPFSDNVGFNLFDTTLGTLTNVTLELKTTSTAEVDIFNSTGSAQPFTNAKATFTLSVNGPPGSTLYLTDTITAGPTAGTAPVGLSSYPGLTGNHDSGIVPVPGGDIGSFEAPGGPPSILPFVVSTPPGDFSGSSVSGVFFSGSGSLGGTLTLVYTYNGQSTPGTPEPGTWALLAATASVSVAGLRRRRALKS